MVATEAHALVGQTTYRWSLTRWHEEFGENIELASGEFSDRFGEGRIGAKNSAERTLAEHPATDQITINRGTYEESILNDGTIIVVYDADWIEDERWVEHGWPHAGSIDWEEEEL